MSGSDDALIQSLRTRLQVEPRSPMWSDVPRAHPVAPMEGVARVEVHLGFALPAFARRIFTEVADGGFGPAYGIFPLVSAYAGSAPRETVIEVRDKLAVDSRWPQKLMPLCDWGCANWSCLDCRTDSGAVVTLAGEDGFFDTGRDLHSWLSAWLDGTELWDEMFELRTQSMINPFTKRSIEIKAPGAPRGRPWPG
jgi:hypothetical protein